MTLNSTLSTVRCGGVIFVILFMFRATHVPVGDDQLKHIELARHLAKAFNKRFGNLFLQPQPVTGDSLH